MIFLSIFASSMWNICIDWDEVQSVGVLDPIIIESSGLVALEDGTLLTHNDSGDGAFLYRVDRSGRLLQTAELSGAAAVDWETLSIGPCGEETCVYIGDVGDNGSARESVTIIRFSLRQLLTDEPTVLLEDYDALEVRYPDGPRDCETVAVDPLTGTLILVEKIPKAEARWYALGLDAWQESVPVDLTQRGVLETGADSFTGGWMTGGEFEPAGGILWTRTYPQGFGWAVQRGVDGEVAALDYLSEFEIPINAQCESLAISADGTELWLSCEGSDGVLATAACATMGDLDEIGPEPTTGQSSSDGCAAGPGDGGLVVWLVMLFSLARRSLSTL